MSVSTHVYPLAQSKAFEHKQPSGQGIPREYRGPQSSVRLHAFMSLSVVVTHFPLLQVAVITVPSHVLSSRVQSDLLSGEQSWAILHSLSQSLSFDRMVPGRQQPSPDWSISIAGCTHFTLHVAADPTVVSKVHGSRSSHDR
jgi:hypothetical protein